MWVCIDCGERNTGTPDECAVCHRPRPAPRAAIWEPPEPPPIWIPEPADPEPNGPPARSRLIPALPIAVLIAALVTAAVLGGPRLLGPDRPAPRAAPVPSAAPTTPILEDDTVDLVTVAAAVTDPRAGDVADMLETYFTGINERDYRAVAGVLDPAGEIDPADARQMAAFAEGTSTTRDSDVVLVRLAEAASGRLRAEVTFRSEQEDGHGPPERLDETCTRWRAVYVLSTAGNTYRMLRGDATNEPC
ncbi:hypothetical protein KZ829_23645 [Actinoplanes hulinensis]|uniref:RanBP2-type domain-containing protein n=1 Tax=Actinoplanes hulinensis TaxID=1144547 RepID=A0ABS7B6Y2_9ACTN|nr:hypothetical protein [Actinoplanes hulinensis]MBW6436740.1 hypothetical protein [Actinoplanes hulinensis]